MNYINARVTSVDSYEGVTIVNFKAEEETLAMMSLELDRSLQVGSEVILAFKATNVSLAKRKDPLLSISNQLVVRIESIQPGTLLSSVKLAFGDSLFESIITKNSALRMALQPQEQIVALIKASDLAIEEIL